MEDKIRDFEASMRLELSKMIFEKAMEEHLEREKRKKKGPRIKLDIKIKKEL